MQNQHEMIEGYRELNQAEIDLINNIKKMGASIGGFLDGLAAIEGVDHRWLAIAQTDLQKGIMAMTRAVAKPEGF